MTEETTLNYPIKSESPLEPPREWAELRGKCPVAHVKFPSGDDATLLTRYDDVKQLLSDPRFIRTSPEGKSARMTEQESGGIMESEMAHVLPQHGEGHRSRWKCCCARCLRSNSPSPPKTSSASRACWSAAWHPYR